MDNKTVLKELGVNIVKRPPIKTNISLIGCINGFFIYPQSYYWVVNGKMPIKYADELYKYRNKYGIRVDGGANDNKPIEHCTSDELEEYCDYMSDKLNFMELEEWIEELTNKKKKLKSENIEKFYVESYHVDNVKGLKKIIDVIKNNNIITTWG